MRWIIEKVKRGFILTEVSNIKQGENIVEVPEVSVYGAPDTLVEYLSNKLGIASKTIETPPVLKKTKPVLPKVNHDVLDDEEF